MLLDRLGGWVGQAVPLSDGSVLAGSDDRLLRFSPDLSRVTAEITPGQGTVMAIHVLDSEILVLTERGLLRLDDRGVVQAFAPGGGESFAVRDDLVAVAAREAGLRLFARQPDGTLIPLPGVLQEKDVLDVAILDGQLFAAAGQGGLYRVDSSQQPATLARVTSVQGADAVTVSGRLLVVGSGPRVFVVDPERDALIGIYTPLGDARRMVVRTDTVLVAVQRDGLKFMWLPTPDRPVQAYTENSSPAYDVALSGNTAVVAGEDNLRLLDIGSLFQPLLLGRVGLPGRPEGVAFDGETAAAALGDDGVALIDATNYATPSLIRRIPLEGPARSVLLDEGWLYAAAGEAGLAAINLAEPEPIYVLLGCTAADLAQRGSVLYIACEEAGLVAVDVLRRAAPAIVGSLAPEAGNAYRTVSIQGKRAYLASDRGVVVADINRPAQMGRLALVREAVNDVGAADTYLYGLHAAGLTTYDIRATAEPGVLNRYRSAEGIADMAAQGNTLLLTNSGPGADIIALSLVTPAAPYELGNLGDTGFGTHITTGERFAWVGLGHGGFQQIELTEGVPLPRTAYMTLPNPGRITTEGQTVIAAGVNGWSVLTMAGPAGLRPQTTVRRDLPIQDIDADGNRIVLAAGEAGLWVYNRAGQLAGRTALTGPVTRVAAVGDLIYAADTSGLAILDARSLTLLNRVTTPVPPMDLLHQGEQVVLLLVDGSLVAIDVSQPAAGLVSLSQIETRRPAQLIPAPYDSSVYTLSENGMLRLNVDDPAQFTVFVRGDLLQVASR
ncbi:MAG: hypothetical protein ACFB51_14330 [Anaerolineae bacterium]